MQDGFAVVGKIQSTEFDLAFYFLIAGFSAILDLRLFLHDLVETNQRRCAALENVDHPAQRDHGKGQLQHVDVEGCQAANLHAAGQHFASTDPQYQHNCQAEHEFQRGPEHAHEPYQFQAAGNVFLVCAFEGSDLRFFLDIGAD